MEERTTPYLGEDGEAYVNLIPDGKTEPEKLRMADLVWKAFNKKDVPAGMKVIYIDGNKMNNALDNLKLEKIA